VYNTILVIPKLVRTGSEQANNFLLTSNFISMSTHARALKAVTKPTVVQKASDSVAAIIAKTDSPQALKDKATALQTVIGSYNTAFDDFNGEATVTTTKAAAVNDDLTLLKTGYTELKTLAKGLVEMGLATQADLTGIEFF